MIFLMDVVLYEVLLLTPAILPALSLHSWTRQLLGASEETVF